MATTNKRLNLVVSQRGTKANKAINVLVPKGEIIIHQFAQKEHTSVHFDLSDLSYNDFTALRQLVRFEFLKRANLA